MKNKNFEFLITGGGIAGLMMAFHLRKAGKSFLVIDNKLAQSSSKIAAGMFNPISGKRMSVNWKAEELLAQLHKDFIEMESLLGANYLVHANILQAFGNVKESNDFMARLDFPAFKQYVDADTMKTCALRNEFGIFEVIGSGWVKTAEWINAFQTFLENEGCFIQDQFKWDEILKAEENWQWKDYQFENIISCEGYQYGQNPYFNWLPFKLCKGQVLLIDCKGLNEKYILKRGVYLVHQYDTIYKVGASYEWDFEDAEPNAAGKETLIEKVKQMIELPFEVIDHLAGIRPTTRDRAAILGQHPTVSNLYVFNGLGTKGMLQAPFLAAHLCNHLLTGERLHKEINLQRFYQFYVSSHSNTKV